MSTRDELIEAAHSAICETNLDHCIEWRGKCAKATDAILAAGYRKPHTVTTAAELADLPDNSVVLVDVTAYQKHGHDAWAGADWNDEYDYTAADLIREASRYNTQTPHITVIYTPGETR